MESKSVHDLMACDCGAMFVDGGLDYVRIGGDPSLIEVLSEHEEEQRME